MKIYFFIISRDAIYQDVLRVENTALIEKSSIGDINWASINNAVSRFWFCIQQIRCSFLIAQTQSSFLELRPCMIKRNKKLTTTQIYQNLRTKIMDFDLFPGTRFTESELAEQFKVSRTPIREALKRLEVEGLIHIRAKQGCFIRPVDTETISNYYDVRVALETMAVELACEHMPRQNIMQIKQWGNL